MRTWIHLFIALAVLYTIGISSCARIVKPPGGPKDTLGPLVSESSPANKSVSFDGNKITIEFDEFIRIDDIENQLVISPLLDQNPDIFMKGKKMVIKLKEPLKENSTYNFNFGESLKDITEGNPLSNFQYTIATGSHLDSMSISGIVTDAFTGEPKENFWVMLYKSGEDSTFQKRKPDYISKSRADGRFIFNALPSGEFEIYALDDQNSNLIYDLPNETIAFRKSSINIDTSNVYDISLNTFVEVEDKALLTGISQTGYGSFVLNYSKYVGETSISSLENIEFLVEKHQSREKDIIWLREKPDSALNIIVSGSNLRTDTSRLTFTNKFNERPDSLYSVTEVSKSRGSSAKIQVDDPILIYFNNPIATIGESMVYLDGSEVSVREVKLGPNPRSISIKAGLESGKTYKIVFTESPIDIYNNSFQQKDSLIMKTRKEEDYAQLSIRTTNYDSSAHYIAGLYLEQNINTIYRNIVFSSDSVTQVADIIPGKYYFIVYDDENQNNKWDIGDYNKGLSPERTWSASKQLNFKANFEVELEQNLEK